MCLAMWQATAAQDIIGKIFGIFFPVAAFVSISFSHVVVCRAVSGKLCHEAPLEGFAGSTSNGPHASMLMRTIASSSHRDSQQHIQNEFLLIIHGGDCCWKACICNHTASCCHINQEHLL